MMNIRKRITAFTLCIAISLTIHVTMLFGLSEIRGLSLFDFQGDEAITVNIENAPVNKPLLTASSKRYPGRPGLNPATDPVRNRKNISENNDAESSPPEPDENNLTSVTSSADAVEKIHAANMQPANFSMYSKEKLSYDIYWYGVYAGNAVLESENKNGIFRIISTVHSAPVISAFYRVEDYAESTVTNGFPFKLRLRLREGSHLSDKETVFDMSSKKVTFINYIKGKRKEHDIPEGVVWDILSGFYYLRTQKLEISRQSYVDIFDSNKFFRAEVDILRKENLQHPVMGEISTIVIKPVLKSEGLFKKTGDIFIWLTDDNRKIPVRVETRIPVGNIVAELRELQFN